MTLLPPAGAGASIDGERPEPAPAPDLLARDLPPRPERILGFDGVVYDSAPPVVEAHDGELYLGLDFDLACAQGARGFQIALRRLTRLVTIIEDSGRRVLFTVVPNKELVVRPELDLGLMPIGECATEALAAQETKLDHSPDRRYLPLRRALARDPRQVYWKSDLHWTTVGASIWAEELATALDPRLASRQRHRDDTQTYVGHLNRMLGLDVPETVPAVVNVGPARARTAKRSHYAFEDPEQFSFDYQWNSRPARATWPGHTLVLGDSFSLMALQNLRPLFRHGRYQWVGNVRPTSMARAIAKADTVVIEVLQLFVSSSPLGQKSFHRQVRKALHRDATR